jgi:DNA-binding Lrp family transcriptional regulator
MEKLDLKDRKILYQLDLDSRQSFRSIGRKVGLTKDVVASRTKRLQEKGIIKKFRTRINLISLGYLFVRTYYIFQYTNPKTKKEIIEYFVNNKDTTVVISLEGSYDLLVNTPNNNMLKLNSFSEQALIKFGDYIAEQASSIYLTCSWYALSFLLDEKDERRELVRPVDERVLPETWKDFKPVKIDELDFKILEILALDARISTTEIAKKLHSTVTIIHHRIKKLMDSRVIEGYGVTLDLGKLGYRFYHVNINLKKLVKRYQIIDYIRNNPHLCCIEKTIGHTADLELEFYLKNVEQLHQIMDDLSMKFPDCIKKFNYFSYLEIHKATFMN